MKTFTAAAFCTLLSTVLTTTTHAAVLANYTFGTLGQETTAETGAPYAATTAQFVTASAIADPTGNVGLEISSAATTPVGAPFLRLDPQGNSVSGPAAVSANKYFEFTVAATTGKFLTLSNLTFDATRGGGATPRGYVVRSSVGNYASDLSSADLSTARPTYTGVVVDLTGTAYTNLLTITFRIYSYAPAAGNSVDYDNIVLNGSVNTIVIPDTNLYSTNVVGFVNLTMPQGFYTIANPVNSANNTVKSLISGIPDFSAVYKWNGNGFDVSTYAFGNWSSPNMTLNPGEGAFFSNAGSSPVTITFAGEVLQGNLVNNIATGFSMKGSQVPQNATVTAMGLNAGAGLTDFDAVYKWNGSSYVTYTYAFGNWAPSSPAISVGEAFFVSAQKPIAWARSFSVNP